MSKGLINPFNGTILVIHIHGNSNKRNIFNVAKKETVAQFCKETLVEVLFEFLTEDVGFQDNEIIQVYMQGNCLHIKDCNDEKHVY